MTTCTKYKCDKCAKEFEDSDKLKDTWFGDNKPQYSDIHYWSFSFLPRKTKKKQIEKFVRLELGDLCKNCFKNAKQLLEEWLKNSPKVECE